MTITLLVIAYLSLTPAYTRSTLVSARGENSASQSFFILMSGSFTKCKKCNVNIPILNPPEFCPVCKTEVIIDSHASRFYITDQRVNKSKDQKKTPELKRRWVELENTKGKVYYHNSDTGEDRWTKPSDFDAMVTPSTIRK